jgi:hypothetical protein
MCTRLLVPSGHGAGSLRGSRLISNVASTLPSERWQQLLSRGDLGSELAHFCSDMNVLRTLSAEYPEACVNYVCGLVASHEWLV